MEAKQVYKKMTRSKWQKASYEPKILIGPQCNSGTAADFEAYISHNVLKVDKAIANSHAIEQAVNGTWLKGLDPNKMEAVVKALIEAKEIIKSFHDVGYESKEHKKKLWNAYNKGSEMKAINQVLESCKL